MNKINWWRVWTNKNNKVEIEKFDLCKKGLDFRKKYKTFEEAWMNCERGDWMLWIAKKYSVDLRKLTLAKALCAKTIIHLMKDERSVKAVKVAEDFGNGIASYEELEIAAKDAAFDAATNAYSNAAALAADAAVDAAAAGIAAAATAIANANANAAYADDAYFAAKQKSLKNSADICRNILTEEIFNKIKEK